MGRRVSHLDRSVTRPAGPARRAPVMTPPVGMVMLFALLLVGVVTLVLIAIGSLSYAYARIGVGGGWMLVVLFAALVGSPINIPVATLPSRLVDTTFTVR